MGSDATGLPAPELNCAQYAVQLLVRVFLAVPHNKARREQPCCVCCFVQFYPIHMTLLRIDQTILEASGDCVVKRDAYLRIVEASEALRLADAHIAQERSKLEALREATRAEAYAEGIEAGKAMVARELSHLLMQADRGVHRLEDRLVATVMSALQHVLGQVEDSARFASLARQAIRSAGEAKRLRLRVAMQDVPAAQQMLETLRAGNVQIEFVDVLEDATMAPGGCMLETEYGAIDGSLEAHLAAVREGLFAAFDAEASRVHSVANNDTSADTSANPSARLTSQ